jgi:hypothetical protein
MIRLLISIILTFFIISNKGYAEDLNPSGDFDNFSPQQIYFNHMNELIREYLDLIRKNEISQLDQYESSKFSHNQPLPIPTLFLTRLQHLGFDYVHSKNEFFEIFRNKTILIKSSDGKDLYYNLNSENFKTAVFFLFSELLKNEVNVDINFDCFKKIFIYRKYLEGITIEHYGPLTHFALEYLILKIKLNWNNKNSTFGDFKMLLADYISDDFIKYESISEVFPFLSNLVKNIVPLRNLYQEKMSQLKKMHQNAVELLITNNNSKNTNNNPEANIYIYEYKKFKSNFIQRFFENEPDWGKLTSNAEIGSIVVEIKVEKKQELFIPTISNFLMVYRDENGIQQRLSLDDIDKVIAKAETDTHSLEIVIKDKPIILVLSESNAFLTLNAGFINLKLKNFKIKKSEKTVKPIGLKPISYVDVPHSVLHNYDHSLIVGGTNSKGQNPHNNGLSCSVLF